MKLNLTSFLGGAVVAVVALLLSGAGSGNGTSTAGGCGCECGRFALITGLNRAFVLDRETGQVWEKFFPVNAGTTSSGFNEAKVSLPEG